jgi:gliding motility-associated-like protein
VQVSNANGCFNRDTATIFGYLENPQNFLDSSADICVGQLLEVKGKVGYDHYRWFNNSTSSTINITAPGVYWLEVTNTEGCIGRDSISVKAKDCLKGVFFPNAFTPSNGGRNNVFRPVFYGQLESFYLIVYNRYGQKVFETRDAYKGWDGKINGIIQTTNTFTWSAIYKFAGAGEKQQTAKGTVTVIR